MEADMRLVLALLLAATLFFSTLANAKNFLESDYGDFSGLPSSPTLLSESFESGTNTVSGQVDFKGGDLYDLFQISLHPQTAITRIIWQATTVQDQRDQTTPYFALGFISIPDSSHTGLDAAGFYTTMSLPEDRTIASDIDPVFFNLSHKIFGSTAGAMDFDSNLAQWIIVPGTESSFSWSITCDVSSQTVPEPSTAVLLAAGMALVAVRRFLIKPCKAPCE
jgi:hypothetical protein